MSDMLNCNFDSLLFSHVQAWLRTWSLQFTWRMCVSTIMYGNASDKIYDE